VSKDLRNPLKAIKFRFILIPTRIPTLRHPKTNPPQVKRAKNQAKLLNKKNLFRAPKSM
jgi:hypothetical protein